MQPWLVEVAVDKSFRNDHQYCSLGELNYLVSFSEIVHLDRWCLVTLLLVSGIILSIWFVGRNGKAAWTSWGRSLPPFLRARARRSLVPDVSRRGLSGSWLAQQSRWYSIHILSWFNIVQPLYCIRTGYQYFCSQKKRKTPPMPCSASLNCSRNDADWKTILTSTVTCQCNVPMSSSLSFFAPAVWREMATR